MKNNVAVLSKISNLIKELRAAVPKINFVEISEGDTEQLYKSEIVIADFDLLNPHLNKLTNTKWIQGTWAGVDKLIPYKNNIPEDLTITRFSGIHFGRLMSEYVVANIVNYEREFYNVYLNNQKKNWILDGKISEHRSISDLKIGILGVGQIGNYIAKTLNAFGAEIWGYGRREKLPENNEYKCFEHYCTREKLPLFLSSCDYIINVLPSTLETTGLLNGNILKNCKDKFVVFINIGRGTIISDDNLIQALKNKWLNFAILDVFNTEPLPSNNELWSMEQVIITPHVAGVSRSKDIAEQFAANYQYYLLGKQIPTTFHIENNY